jgi:hypothetical protein
MKKYVLPLFGITVLAAGLLTAVYFSRSQAILKNKAANTEGSGIIYLSPDSSTKQIGETFPVTLKFNTHSTNISSLSVRLNYTGGLEANEIVIDKDLISSGNWSFPINKIKRNGKDVTIDLVALNTSIGGFSSTDDINLANINFKVINKDTNPVILNFDIPQTKMITKTPEVDILQAARGATYIISDSTSTSSTVNFTVKLQGIDSKIDTSDTKLASFTLKNTINTVYSNNLNLVQEDLTGAYTGTVTNITPGTYEIYIKEPTHLARKFTSISLPENKNLPLPLLAGDFNNDNIINLIDFGKFLSIYTTINQPVTEATKIYDVNGDGTINIIDIGIPLSNYTQIEIRGD